MGRMAFTYTAAASQHRDQPAHAQQRYTASGWQQQERRFQLPKPAKPGSSEHPAAHSSFSMCMSVVLPALSNPRNRILAFLLAVGSSQSRRCRQ